MQTYNCYTEHEISGMYAGGICGDSAGGDAGNVTISNCYTEGEISGENAGGICGSYAGTDGGTVTISIFPLPIGNVSVKDAGGIYMDRRQYMVVGL